MVLTPSAVGGYGPPWMSRFLAAGGGKYADIMAFHGYLAPDADAETIIHTIADFKAVFAKHGQETNRFGIRKQSWGQNSSAPGPGSAGGLSREVLPVALVGRRRKVLLVRV